MSTISQYAFEDADGVEDSYTTFDLGEAYERARKYKLRVIDREYEYSDSTVIADYTGKPTAGFEDNPVLKGDT